MVLKGLVLGKSGRGFFSFLVSVGPSDRVVLGLFSLRKSTPTFSFQICESLRVRDWG